MFHNFKTGKMVYTLDGSDPTTQSTEYTSPLFFEGSATIKIATVLPSGKLSKVRTITMENKVLFLQKKSQKPKKVLRCT